MRRSGLVALALAGCMLAGPAIASEVVPGKGSIEVAFSPADDPEALIIRMIDDARAALQVHAYVFTSRNIAQAVVRAHRRGVRVEVLADAGMNGRERGNAIPQLLDAGVPVAFETEYAAAHNKVLIADADGPGCAVLTGSYNFTWSARNRNAENVLLVRDNCELARIYRANWAHHREKATIVTRLPFTPGR